MAHPTPNLNFDQSSLEKALRVALKSVLERDGSPDPRTSFYDKFKEEVAEHDEDLQKKHDEDLNSTLIFSGLFSAVTSAFIIAIQSELQPDYDKMNNTLLELLLNATVGNLPPGQPVHPPRWTGPDPAVRQVQATLYVTLCATLFAAFLATLGKQWLNRYTRADTHGSIEDRCRDRERKMTGIDRWWFHTIMQFAPLTIQGSLALLGTALSRYLWEVDRVVSSVVIGFTSVGCILYVIIVTISVRSFDCPFQTPVSLLIRSVVDAVDLWRQDHIRADPHHPAGLPGGILTFGALPFPSLYRRVLHSTLSHSWEKGYKFDARCITRMLMLSTDLNTIRITMDFVQEVIWDARIKTIPLGWIYKKLISCFDFTHPRTPILIPTLRDVAYLSAKAFTHIQVQQRCIPEHRTTSRVDEDWRTGTPHTPLGSLGLTADPDLESALLMVDNAFGSKVRIPWDEYRLSAGHHLWVSHLFVYHTRHNPRSKDVTSFVKYSLDPDKPPSDAVIANCLYMIDMILGTHFCIEDLTKRDKSRQIDTMVNGIFQNISRRFQAPLPLTNADVSDEPLQALKLITRLSTTAVATESYDLFRVIMESKVGEEKKMEAARLTLCAAYRSTLASVPPVGNPNHILDFLRYHVGPLVKGEVRTRAISSAMRALDSAYDDPTSQSWTWRIENAGELLTVFQQSPHPEEFKWWYRVLWTNYGRLEASVLNRLDDIAMNGGDKIDLEQCRIAIEKEIERVKGLDGATGVVNLEEAYSRLTSFIHHGDKSRPSISWPTDSPHIVRDYRRRTTMLPNVR